jgi:hypothetical protein
MADETTPPVVTPGPSTSEGKLAIVATILSVLGAVIPPLWIALTDIATKFPDVRWIAGLVSVAGILSSILVSLGYSKTRTALKIAALNAGP